MSFQNEGGCNGILQSRLCIVHMTAPYLPAYLLNKQGVVPCLELFCAPYSYNRVSCDDTGGRTVLPWRQIWFEDRQPLLIDWKVGDTLHWDFECGHLEKGRDEGVLQGLLDRAEHLPNVWSDALD